MFNMKNAPAQNSRNTDAIQMWVWAGLSFGVQPLFEQVAHDFAGGAARKFGLGDKDELLGQFIARQLSGHLLKQVSRA